MGPDVDSFTSFSTTRRFALKGAGVASLMALAGRGSLIAARAQDATPAASGDYPTVAFTARDYEFLDLPATIEGGLTRLSMANEGPADHHAMFVRINDGSTPDDFMAALQTGDLGQILSVAASLGGPGSVGPGVTSDVIVDLTPGQYMVVCLIPDEETGMPHAAMGMISPLEVTEASATAAPPETEAQVDLADFHFMGIPSEMAAGPRVWAVTDTGEQLHELVIYQQAPGVPYSVIESIFLAPPAASPVASPAGIEATPETMASPESSPEAAGPPPFMAVVGVAPMSPGVTNYAELELQAGDYFAICFIPDPATGAPHFALGMIMPFTVA